MSKKQSIGPILGSMLNIGTAVPAGAATGITLDDPTLGNTRPSAYLITAVVSAAPSDLLLYGRVASGVDLDESDDIWGLFNDKYGTRLNGRIGAALVIGTHHFVIEDLGVFSELFFVKSAGTVNVSVRPIFYSSRAS